jgi:hypothetical protein
MTVGKGLRTILVAGSAATCGLLLATAAEAKVVEVSITNNQAAGGLYLTPLLSIFHDGTFDPFDVDSAASQAVEDLAEEGDGMGLLTEAGVPSSGPILSPGGFAGAPVIDPGETATLRFDVDEGSDRYFSFFSMVIPSNDNFVGNDNPTAYEVFDADGRFAFVGPIEVLGSEV